MLGEGIKIEVKATNHANDRCAKSRRAVREEELLRRYVVVSQAALPWVADGIGVLPRQESAEWSWGGRILIGRGSRAFGAAPA